MIWSHCTLQIRRLNHKSIYLKDFWFEKKCQNLAYRNQSSKIPNLNSSGGAGESIIIFFRAHFTTHKLFHHRFHRVLKIWKTILAFVYKFEKTETPESIDIRVFLVHAIYVVASLEPLLSLTHSNTKIVKKINISKKINNNSKRFSWLNNAHTSPDKDPE